MRVSKMKFTVLMFVQITFFTSGVLSQLSVEIREYSTEECDHITQFQNSSKNFTILASYTFPDGFTSPLDWFTEPYANIPPDGITGILYYPLPHDACSSLVQQIEGDCISSCTRTLFNLTLHFALVDDYHTCIEEKLNNLREFQYSALITSSQDDTNQHVNDRVFDRTTQQEFDILATGFPVAVVSRAFARTLANTAALDCTDINSNCSINVLRVVHIRTDTTKQSWVQIGIGAFLMIVVVGLPLLTCACLCFYCGNIYMSGKCNSSCCKYCKRLCSCKDRCRFDGCWRSGVYEVHELQLQVLGESFEQTGRVQNTTQDSTREARSNGNLIVLNEISIDGAGGHFQRRLETPQACVEKKFDAEIRGKSHVCAICLEDFKEGETVHALPCDEGHIFHSGCIDKWLQTHSMCPICRTFIANPFY